MALFNVSYFDFNHVKRSIVFDNSSKNITYVPALSGGVNPTAPIKNPGEEFHTDGVNQTMAFPIYPWAVYKDNTSQPTGLHFEYTAGANSITIANDDMNAALDYRLISWDGSFDSGWQQAFGTHNTGFTFLAKPKGKYVGMVRFRATPNRFAISGAGVVQDPLAAKIEGSNISFPTGTDGVVKVTTLSGSGDYTVTWYDATVDNLNNGKSVQMATKTDLPAGTYTAVVHDNVLGTDVNLSITLTEPVLHFEEETFFNVPKCQSIEFTHEVQPDNYSVLQNLDNVRYVNQKFHIGFNAEYYAQKVCSLDVRTIQWQSNYPAHKVDIFDCDNNLISSLDSAMKVKNVGVRTDYPITIRGHAGDDQTKIYFHTSVFPIPLKVGDVFGVNENAPDLGYNGNYEVVEIALDTVRNAQYLLINRPYTALVDESEANGVFFVSLVNFNVFECIVDFSLLDTNKEYFIEVYPIVTTGDQQVTAISEPIDLQDEHNGTNLVEFSNEDNAWDIDYSTGIKHFLRVESVLFNRNPKSIINTTRNTTGQLIKLRALKQRGLLFELVKIPPYLHEKLSIACDSDFLYINGVRYATDQQYSAPNYLFNYGLSDATIEIEQFEWMKTYNSNDLNGQLLPEESRIFDDTFDNTFN